MTDRAFLGAFGSSVAIHLCLLGLGVFSLGWLKTQRAQESLEVIYEAMAAEQQLQQLSLQHAQAMRAGIVGPAPSQPLGGSVHLHIPEGSLLASGDLIPDIRVAQHSVIDLTNPMEAAQGNPMLLAYLNALKDHITQTVDAHPEWRKGVVGEGLVYVAFVLTPDGSLEDLSLVPKRSSGIAALRDIALRIVRSSAPFPSFPPSMQEPRTILVPFEFRLSP